MSNKSRTSTAVKRRYNEKTYTLLAAQLPKQLVAEFKERCKENGVRKPAYWNWPLKIISVRKTRYESYVIER